MIGACIWTTYNELAYLNSIGQASPMTCMMSRRMLLLGYLDGAERRVRWGRLDRDRILTHARQWLTLLALEAEEVV